MGFTFKIDGAKDTLAVFDDLRDQIGDARKSSRILTKVARDAMKPVLAMAKSLTSAHMDTGMLNRSLDIVSRRPSKKDMRSNYILPTDSVIAMVTTKPIPRKLKSEMHAEVGHLWESDKKSFKKARKKFYESKDVFYDARAVATEFGTANRSANPYLRISLESQQQSVAQLVQMLLAKEIEKYKAKNINTSPKL
jgi:hypothetical protein